MAIKTIKGAGTFVVSNNNTVTNVTDTFIKVNPLLCTIVIAEAKINPQATGAMPLMDNFIALIPFNCSQTG